MEKTPSGLRSSTKYVTIESGKNVGLLEVRAGEGFEKDLGNVTHLQFNVLRGSDPWLLGITDHRGKDIADAAPSEFWLRSQSNNRFIAFEWNVNRTLYFHLKTLPNENATQKITVAITFSYEENNHECSH